MLFVPFPSSACELLAFFCSLPSPGYFPLALGPQFLEFASTCLPFLQFRSLTVLFLFTPLCFSPSSSSLRSSRPPLSLVFQYIMLLLFFPFPLSCFNVLSHSLYCPIPSVPHLHYSFHLSLDSYLINGPFCPFYSSFTLLFFSLVLNSPAHSLRLPVPVFLLAFSSIYYPLCISPYPSLNSCAVPSYANPFYLRVSFPFPFLNFLSLSLAGQSLLFLHFPCSFLLPHIFH